MIVHTRVCVECKESKRLKQFDYCKTCKYERKNVCISCLRFKKTKYLESNMGDATLTETRLRDTMLKAKYGISIEEYNKMFLEQNGSCKICKTHQSELPKKLAVDHCHESGNVRALLCARCNTGIGLLKEDISILAEAIKYLIHFR